MDVVASTFSQDVRVLVEVPPDGVASMLRQDIAHLVEVPLMHMDVVMEP
jgi:hypothetical protein